jgi:cellobiose-specific phosphotransferase system component IIC
MSARWKDDKDERPNPLQPFIGFVVLLVLGGFSFLAAPTVVKALTTVEFSMGFLGPVLPITFPETWSPFVSNTVIALVLMFVLFTLVMILMIPFLKPPGHELDVRDPVVLSRKEKRRRKKRR